MEPAWWRACCGRRGESLAKPTRVYGRELTAAEQALTDLDAVNEALHHEYAALSYAEALAFWRTMHTEAVAQAARLSDAQLEAPARLDWCGPLRCVALCRAGCGLVLWRCVVRGCGRVWVLWPWTAAVARFWAIGPTVSPSDRSPGVSCPGRLTRRAWFAVPRSAWGRQERTLDGYCSASIRCAPGASPRSSAPTGSC